MSASSTPPRPPENHQSANAYDAFREAEIGDKVLFGDRKQPMSVIDTELDSETNRHRLALRGPRGGEVTVMEQYTPTKDPDYRSDRGRQANNLRIVERADEDGGSAGSNPRGQASKTTTQDGGDGATGGARYTAAADTDIDFEADDTPGQPWPQPPEDSDEDDLEDLTYDATGDMMADADDLFEGTVEGEIVREDTSHPFDEFGTYTFVDELLAIGQDVPKTVNSWHLVDYGLVEDGVSRRAAWINTDKEELLVLGLVNEDGGEPDWYVWHVRNPRDGDFDPVLQTKDPYHALDAVSDVLYDGIDQVDISIEEDDNGDITVKSAMDDESLAEKVMDQLGIVTEPIGGARARISENVGVDYPGGAQAWVGDTAQNVVDFFGRNKTQFAQMVKYAVVFIVVRASRRLSAAGVSPIVEQDRFGLAVDAKYTAQDIRSVTGPVPYVDDVLSWFQATSKDEVALKMFDTTWDDLSSSQKSDVRERMSEPVSTFETDTEFTIDPRQFDFAKGPVTAAGLNYERLVDIADIFNLENMELRVPGADTIRRLRVAEDDDGNVKVVKAERDVAALDPAQRRSRGVLREDEDEDSDTQTRRSSSGGSSGGSRASASDFAARGSNRPRSAAMSTANDLDWDDGTHRRNGEPTSKHKGELTNALGDAGGKQEAIGAANRFAARYVIEALEEEESDDFDIGSVSQGKVGQYVGGEWRPAVNEDVLSFFFDTPKNASHPPTIAAIIRNREGDDNSWAKATRRAMEGDKEWSVTYLNPEDEGTPTASGGNSDTDEMVDEGEEAMSGALDNIAADVGELTEEQLEEMDNRVAESDSPAANAYEGAAADNPSDEMISDALSQGAAMPDAVEWDEEDLEEILYEKSEDDWTAQDAVILGAWSGRDTKAGVMRYIADVWGDMAGEMGLDGYTDEEIRDGEPTRDAFGME